MAHSEIVLVTGGQGFLGQHLIRLLQQDERVAEIRVLDIESFSNRIGFEEKKILKSYVADITKPETLTREIFQGVHCVFHVAASTGFTRFKSAKVLEEVNVNGTRNIIHQCIDANVNRLVYTSSTATVVPKREPLILSGEHTASAPPKTGFLFGHYGSTKLEAENLVRKANGQMLANGNGTLLTICLRPTVLYGELDPYYVTAALKFGKENDNILQKFGWGGERNQTTYAGNAAWSHILAKNTLLEDPQSVAGEAIFITDDTIIQAPFDFLEPFLKVRNMTISSKPYTATFAVLFTLLLYTLTRILKPIISIRYPFPHPATVFFMTNFYCFNRLKATLRLGYKPIYKPEESMANSLEYYKKIVL